ncbi:small oligopeptide transporter [Xylariales sp. PMI_506]|nr:small oligopeptide transporter [Xylariales sp. PMI_506]
MPFGLGSKKVADADPVEVIGDEEVEVAQGPSPPEIEEKFPQNIPHEHMSDDLAAQKLKLYKIGARHDPNLPEEDLDAIDSAVESHDSKKENALVDGLVENSPYPEVRASVRNYDVDVPANTIRAWVIGMLLTTVFSGVNALFSLRAEQISITSIVSQLVAYPLGIGWAYVIPNHQFDMLGVKFNLNPGPFNFKEHALVVLMANASYGSGPGYFTYILTAQKAYYGLDWGWGYDILLGMTTMCLGFGLAGLARRWVVQPANMIWPSMLVNSQFMYALHDHSPTDPATSNGWSIPRYRYFLYVMIGGFVWYWFPGFLFPALSVFVFPTWIAPNNVTVNQVFGGFSGMGLLPLTFDWSVISAFLMSPLIPPFHALANTMIGVVLFYWIIAPALHWSNVYWAQYLPFFDSGSWDNTQNPYNVSRILTPGFTLDLDKYNSYSPLFLTTTFAISYGLSFSSIVATIVNTVIFHGKEIWARSRDTEGKLDDIHMKMMRKYKPVPQWWFLVVFVIFLALSFVVSYVWDTGLTWWGLIIAVIIAAVWLVPVGIIQATTNIQIGLNVITELLVGFMLPGRPIAMMMFKTYGYISMGQALAFLEDMKLGHYLKLPPRTMFFGQLIATMWSAIVQVAVFRWALATFENVCTPEAAAEFTCPAGRVFFTASIIFGLIGPLRIFGSSSIYSKLNWFWLIGAALPIIHWAALKKWPRSVLRYLNVPVLLNGNALIPPANPLNYGAWFTVGAIFNKWIRGRWTGWWMRYNYVTSAALDSGLVLSIVVIVLCLSLTNTSPPSWWGTVGYADTMDRQGTAIQMMLDPGETFGPPTW